MVEQLTESQQKWFDLAAGHADDFATRAAQHDSENSFPFENYEAMKASGYTNMAIPKELGGGGASLLDICIAQERLARGDGATALAINMHHGLPWMITQLWQSGDQGVRPLLENIAKGRLISCGCFTDPAVDSLKGITGLGYTTVKAERTDGGFRINGRHAFGTNSPAGNLFASTAVYNDPVEGDVGLIFFIPINTPGLECQNDWNTMGMRSSSSHSWVLNNLFIAENEVFRHKVWEWDDFARLLFAWHGGTFSAVYLGIARAARDFAVQHTRNRTRLPFKHPESFYPGQQFLAAEMDIGLKAAWAFQTQLATRLADPQARDYQTVIDAIAMQYFCMHTAVDVVNKAIDMVGGAALARRLPLERYYRDVRAGPMHPIGGYDALELIGKHAFGIPRDSEPRYV
ncbi:MAG: acyl-CoA dehydrogenase family protein [Chloroflexota bacterium]